MSANVDDMFYTIHPMMPNPIYFFFFCGTGWKKLAIPLFPPFSLDGLLLDGVLSFDDSSSTIGSSLAPLSFSFASSVRSTDAGVDLGLLKYLDVTGSDGFTFLAGFPVAFAFVFDGAEDVVGGMDDVLDVLDVDGVVDDGADGVDLGSAGGDLSWRKMSSGFELDRDVDDESED